MKKTNASINQDGWVCLTACLATYKNGYVKDNTYIVQKMRKANRPTGPSRLAILR